MCFRSDGNSENEIEPDWFLTIRDTSPVVQLNNDVSKRPLVTALVTTAQWGLP